MELRQKPLVLGNRKNQWLVGLVSAALVASTQFWEGTKYVPYEDVVGVLTVCTGYAGKDVVRNKTYSKQECADMLQSSLKEHQAYVLKCVTQPMKQNEFDAFTLFTYNVGGGAFCGSTLLKKYNAGDVVGACEGLLAWSKAGGKYVQGLNNRRQYERKMCLGELK